MREHLPTYKASKGKESDDSNDWGSLGTDGWVSPYGCWDGAADPRLCS